MEIEMVVCVKTDEKSNEKMNLLRIIDSLIE